MEKLDYNQLQDELDQAKAELEEHALIPEAQEETEGVWLISYADLMTLLMGFFALMTSLGTFDEEKFTSFGEQIAEFTGGEVDVTNEFEKIGEDLKGLLSEKGLSESVNVEVNKSNITINFTGKVLFTSGSIQLKEEAEKLMDDISSSVQEQTSDKKILIEGHTDSVPINRGLVASNWELSSLRANAIARLFEDTGFSKDQILTIGFGETRPAVAGENAAELSDEEINTKNRRVVVKIMNKLPF